MSLLESQRFPNSHVPVTVVVTALKRENYSSPLQRFETWRQAVVQCLGLVILLSNCVGGCTHQFYSESLWEMLFYLDVLIRVLKSFVPEKESLKIIPDFI